MSASYRRALRPGPFLRLLAGHGIGTLGQLQLTMAVGVHVLARTDSGTWVSVAVAMGIAPYVLFSAAAGMFADRHRRSSVLRWSLSARIITGSLITAGLVHDWPVAVVVMLGALTAVVATPSYPALAAATPQTVLDIDLPAANSVATGVENAAWVAGPGLLGLVLLTGAPVAGGGFAATACFVVALVCLGRTHTAPPRRATNGRSVQEEALEGLRAITSDRRIGAALAAAIVDNFLYGYMAVALVLLGDRTFQAGNQGIGWLNAAFAVGAFASLVITPRLASAGREPRVLIIGLTLFVAAVAGVAMAPGLAIAVPLVLLAGALTLIVEIVAVTRIQRLAPEAVTARIFGIYDTLAVGVVGLGSVLAGVLSEVMGVTSAMLAACLVTLALTGACAPALRTTSRPEDIGTKALPEIEGEG